MSGKSLRDWCAEFADEIQTTLRAVLPGTIDIQSTAAPAKEDRYVLAPAGKGQGIPRIPLYVDGEELAGLSLRIFLGMDRLDHYLKTHRMDLAVYSTLDRTPLVRLDFRADMSADPISHWQVHA